MRTASGPMQVSIINERFTLHFTPLSIDYEPLYRFLRDKWVEIHPFENTSPGTVTDTFVVRELNCALNVAAEEACGKEINKPNVSSPSQDGVAPTLEKTFVVRQVTAMLVQSLSATVVVPPRPGFKPFIGEENAFDLATNLFFTLASAAFRLSRDANPAQNVRARMQHNALFSLCIDTFRNHYDSKVGTLLSQSVPKRCAPSQLTAELFSKYRAYVREAFPTASGRSAGTDTRCSAVIRQLVQQGEDTAAAPTASTSTLTTTRRARTTTTTMTPSAPPSAPTLQTQPRPPVQVVNESAMMENELLLPDAEWQTRAVSSCPACGHSLSWLAAVYSMNLHRRNSANCRACGRVLCSQCVTFHAHCSFAKLSNPNEPAEGEFRLVCGTCFKNFSGFQQLRFLGAMFAFAGLDMVHLLLSLGVGKGWSAAAELCIGDHRFLLHTLSSKSHLVLSPVRVLLQNSVSLLMAPRSETGEGPRVVVWHPEAVLQLLRLIAEDRLWSQPEVERLVAMVSDCRLECQQPHDAGSAGCQSQNATDHLSHNHMWCTQLCPQMRPLFFYMQAMEQIATAPPNCGYAREALVSLSQLARASITAGPSGSLIAPVQDDGASSHTFIANPRVTAAPSTEADGPVPIGELELLAVWLMDMAQRPRCADALEMRDTARKSLAALVGQSPQLVCWVLSMVQKEDISAGTYSEEGDFHQLLLSHIADPALRLRAENTVDILKRLDRWVRGQPRSRFTVAGICTWFATNFTSVSPEMTGFHHSAIHPAAARTLARARQPHRQRDVVDADDYLDLRSPLCDPLHATAITLRSLCLAGMRQEEASFGKLASIWICFSSWSRAHRELVSAQETEPACAEQFATLSDTEMANNVVPADADDGHRRAPSLTPTDTTDTVVPVDAHQQARLKEVEAAEGVEEVRRSYLYKLENVDADNLMCVSFRLLQCLLRDYLEGAQIPNYGVVPLSMNSGLIEKAPGVPLAHVKNLPDSLSCLPRAPEQAPRNFLTSLKLFLLLNHIFGIGDRHKGNVMISPHGAIFHIDFGYVFHQHPPREMLSPAVRLDRNILTAAEACLRRLEATSPTVSSAAPAPEGQVGNWFCSEVADLLLLLRPHAALFFHLWRYAVHRTGLLGGREQALADYFNRLFDTTAFSESCRKHFISAMQHSISTWALKDNSRDVTYTILQFLHL